MNRCITCGKTVSRLQTQNVVRRDGHEYLVCCPLCEAEFLKKPEYYIAVARSAYGDYPLKAHTQINRLPDGYTKPNRNNAEYLRLLSNLQKDFDEIERSYKELDRHFDRLSESGGIEGLRKELENHRELMESLLEKIIVHSGVCRFVVSLAESEIYQKNPEHSRAPAGRN